jgi:glutamate synthase domain-containing protein 2
MRPTRHRGIPPAPDEWGYTDIARKAVYGRAAVYPLYPGVTEECVGEALLSVQNIEGPVRRFYSLDDIILLPPQFTPLRLKKAMELVREPIYADVTTETTIGGFRVKLPIVVAAMGSQPVAHKRGLILSRGAAKAGIVLVVGENVATVHGYERRLSGHPSFKERALAYLENVEGGFGGLVIQQSVEDANFELWKKVYSDPDFDEYIRKGLVGFEIKCGQGAKPGLGGEIMVTREVALRLRDRFHLSDDPEEAVRDFYERHSVPGTFTEEILSEQIRGMVNEYRSQYRRVKIWVKTGPYRDLDRVIDVVDRAGADCITIDGKEGGTGMAPTVALRDLGYPTLVCLKRIHDAKMRGVKVDMIISGGLSDGGDVVKALCLGADAVAMGRPFLVASEARVGPAHTPTKRLENPAMGVVNFVEALRVEIQMLTSALGKYSIHDLSREDVGALRRAVSEMFGIEYVYGRRP